MDKKPIDDITGGPAFPVQVDTPFGDGRLAVGGMTLLDWFAGMIRHDELGLPVSVQEGADFLGIPVQEYSSDQHWPKIIARQKYNYAAAMIEEHWRRIEE